MTALSLGPQESHTLQKVTQALTLSWLEKSVPIPAGYPLFIYCRHPRRPPSFDALVKRDDFAPDQRLSPSGGGGAGTGKACLASLHP